MAHPHTDDLGERYYAYVHGSIDWPSFASGAEYAESLTDLLSLAGGQRRASARHDTAFITLKASAARAANKPRGACESLKYAVNAFEDHPEETDLLDVIVHMTGYVAQRFPKGNKDLIEKANRVVIEHYEGV